MTFRKFICSFFILVTSTLCIVAEAQTRNRIYQEYIDQYKDLAVRHQKKYKIPSSITLAQGLLESGAGRGTLARKSNNHFGIKCHNGWSGGRVYHDDDEKGECFRKYSHPSESYEDHSLFLTRNMRYSCLFDLRSTDYKGWARGLQRCGYATDKAYASKLIQLIELYELYEYDRKGASVLDKPVMPAGYRPHTVYKSCGLLYIETRPGDNLKDIAKEFDLSVKKLTKYNEIPADYPLDNGTVIYLEKKNRKADKQYLRHIVSAGESMHDISQRYGIRLKNLYKMNDRDFDYVPAEGDVLLLR